VLFIGTQYSNLYTTVDTPAEAAWSNDQEVSYTAGEQPLSGTGDGPGSHWP
jgi:hypothetical protein